MKGFFAAAAVVGAALANPFPQTASASASPIAAGAPPAGCSGTRAGSFSISVVNVTQSAKRDLESRQADGQLTITLNDGVLTDSQGRTGCIVANRQFQFDNPIQAGAIYTSGWSVCSNGSLAIGGNAIFYQCLSGTFYNLYDQSQGNQCGAVYIVASGAAAGGASGTVSQLSDGQPQATSAQVSQISDGQVQATTRPVSQISDGQIQASTGAPVTQISDGQIQAPTATGRPVTQISDGQIQATTGNPVSQISDGQIQASTGRPVSQISDGQIQAPTSTSPAVATFTGAAARELAGSFAFVAGIVGAIAML